VDRRRQVLLLRIAGFTCLALGLLGSIACFAFGVVTVVDAVGQFHTVGVPGRRLLNLEQRHYVIYYEQTITTPEATDVSGLTVSIRPGAGARDSLPISGYDTAFTYSRGSYFGRAVATFDAPRSGPYVITTSNPSAGAGGARIVVGPSVLGLLTHDLLPGALGAIVLFFGVGGVGALLLTLSDRRERPKETETVATPT
jgi:hypothetical protein